MSIATMEALTALPTGTTVNVSGVPWTVVEEQVLINGSQRLSMELFEGQIAEGHLTQGPLYHAGQVFTSGRRHYYLGNIGSDGAIDYVVFRDGEYLSVNTLTPSGRDDFGTLVTEDPPWLTTSVKVMADLLIRGSRETRERQAHVCPGDPEATARLERQVRSAVDQRDTVRAQYEGLINGLSEWAIEQDDDLDSELAEIFEDHEITYRSTEGIEVTVFITGTTSVDIETRESFSYVNGLISESEVVDWESNNESVLNLTWSGTAVIPVEVNRGDCGCNEVGDHEVDNWLNEHDVNFDDFTVNSSSCSNCS